MPSNCLRLHKYFYVFCVKSIPLTLAIIHARMCMRLRVTDGACILRAG
nr:MAG TPA: hypothetical protein [Caudoviricetes sp.]